MSSIKRVETGERMSQAVVHGGLVWLCGQCGTAGNDIATQTEESLTKIDQLLREVGSDQSRIISATIWLSNINDYDKMNVVWDAWMPNGCAPARSCGEVEIAGDGYGVEIICVAALGGKDVTT